MLIYPGSVRTQTRGERRPASVKARHRAQNEGFVDSHERCSLPAIRGNECSSRVKIRKAIFPRFTIRGDQLKAVLQAIDAAGDISTLRAERHSCLAPTAQRSRSGAETRHLENRDSRRGTDVMSMLTLNFAGVIWNWNSGAFELFPAGDHFSYDASWWW